MRSSARFLVAMVTGLAVFTASPGAAQMGGPIKIGQLLPMTGNFASSLKMQRQGAELAVEEVNKAGGVKGRMLQLVREDDKSTDPGAVQAFQKLIEDKEMVAVIGSIRSTQILAMLPTINEAQIPVMIGGTNFSLTHQGSRWVFRHRPHDGFSAQVMVKFVVEELKKNKLAIVHTSDGFGNGGRDEVVKGLKARQMEPVVIKAINTGDKDYTAVVTAVKNSGADALVTYFTSTSDLAIFATQAKQQGLLPQMTWIGSPSITTTDATKLAGDALVGTYGIGDYDPTGNPTAGAFQVAYKTKFNEDTDLFSAWTYDAVYNLATAMTRAPDLKPDSIRAGILAIKKRMGAENEYTFDERGDGLDHYYILHNEGGTWKVLKAVHVERY
jgi:branched-chain amino acid transport system substrate-binding protein